MRKIIKKVNMFQRRLICNSILEVISCILIIMCGLGIIGSWQSSDTRIIIIYLLALIIILVMFRAYFSTLRKNCKKYFSKFDHPFKQLRHLNKEWNAVGKCHNTLISQECIFYKKDNIIVDATKLLYVDYKKQTENTRYDVMLYLSDSTQYTFTYSSLEDAQEVVSKMGQIMPYIYVGENEEILKQYNEDLETLIQQVENAKCYGQSNNNERSTSNIQDSSTDQKEKLNILEMIALWLLLIFMVAVAVVATVFKWLMVMLFLGVSFASGFELYENITNCSVPVNAEITHIQYINENEEKKCIPTYTYTVEGQKIEVIAQDSYDIDDSNIELGHTLKLYYNPNNPNSYFNRATITSTLNFITIFVIIAFFIAIMPLDDIINAMI